MPIKDLKNINSSTGIFSNNFAQIACKAKNREARNKKICPPLLSTFYSNLEYADIS